MIKFLLTKKRVESFYPFFLVVLFGCGASDWQVIENFENGKTKSMMLVIDKEDSTLMIKEIYESGNLKSIYQYNSGNLDGLAIGLYDDGVVAKKVNFKNGAKHGAELLYFPEGQLRAKFKYNEGIRYDGCFYFKNGQPTATLTFDSLGAISSGVYYYENGNIRSEGAFNEVNRGAKEGYWRNFFENGNIKDEGNYIKGEKKGEWIYYDSLGNIRMTVPFK